MKFPRSNFYSFLKYTFLCVLLFFLCRSFHFTHLFHKNSQPEPEWPQVDFHITYESETDANSYRTLIENLRTAVTGTRTPTLYDAFRVLPIPSKVKDQARFVIAKLTNVRDQSISVALDVTDMYVVGYKCGDVAIFLDGYDIDKLPFKNLFKDNIKKRHKLPYDGEYGHLLAKVPRAKGEVISKETISLGIRELNFGIQELCRTQTTGDQNFRARHFIVLIEMIAEAVRFDYFKREVESLIRKFESFPPSKNSIELENMWKRLSKAIQQAVGGTFQKPVQLFGKTFDSVNDELKTIVTVLKYVSKTESTTSTYESQDEL